MPTKKHKLKEKDFRLLKQMLKSNVLIVKNIIKIYNAIHGNKEPDFECISLYFDEIRLWLKQIEKIRAYIYEQKFNSKGLVLKFVKDTESFADWVKEREEHVSEVRKKIETYSTTWEYSDKNLKYAPENWLDKSSIELANYLDFQLD